MNRRTSAGTDLESVAFDLAWQPSHEAKLVTKSTLLNCLTASRKRRTLAQVMTSTPVGRTIAVCSVWLTIPPRTSLRIAYDDIWPCLSKVRR